VPSSTGAGRSRLPDRAGKAGSSAQDRDALDAHRRLQLGLGERLLEIAKSARNAESIQNLDELQSEIDTIQGEMIQEVEASTLDDTAIMAYALSIERAQLAISDRRTALTGQPPRSLAAVASL